MIDFVMLTASSVSGDFGWALKSSLERIAKRSVQ